MRIIQAAPGSDPASRSTFFVTCDVHKWYAPIEIPEERWDKVMSYEGAGLWTLAAEAAKKCPGCIDEFNRRVPPTRWPEGAEL